MQIKNHEVPLARITGRTEAGRQESVAVSSILIDVSDSPLRPGRACTAATVEK
jgi:hypothetical protein